MLSTPFFERPEIDTISQFLEEAMQKRSLFPAIALAAALAPTALNGYFQRLRALGAWWRLGSSVLRPQLLVESLAEVSRLTAEVSSR